MRSFWAVVAAVLARDVRAEWRRKDIFTTIVMFGLLTVVVFVFAFDPARHAREDVVPRHAVDGVLLRRYPRPES